MEPAIPPNSEAGQKGVGHQEPGPMQGFLLTRQWRDTEQGIELSFWLATEQGPVQALVAGQEAVFFVLASAMPRVRLLLAPLSGWRCRTVALRNFHQEPVEALYFSSMVQFYRAKDLLLQQGISPLEADIRPPDRYLMERFITASLEVIAAPTSASGAVSGTRFQRYLNPQLKQTDYLPKLSVVSLDIETAYNSQDLYSIAVVGERHLPPVTGGDLANKVDAKAELTPPKASNKATNNKGRQASTELIREAKLFMIGTSEDQQAAQQADLHYVEMVANETELLERFIAWLAQYDPDVLIGWNLINFDLAFLRRKAEQLHVPLWLGRDNQPLHWRSQRDNPERNHVLIPGRVVLDGIDTLKTATYQFANFSLDAVARELLGVGKAVDDVDQRGQKIQDWFFTDKNSLAHYNLQDCILVLDIFAKTQLLDFAVQRAQLNGLPMDRVGGSVAAFDTNYLPRLHRQGYVAPNLPENPQGVGSPGGYVMDSKPGLYRHVLVLDFKSLYPSIIRTFAIDPMGLVEGLRSAPEQTVPGFNGARFSRQQHILPGIIEHLWQARDQAKAERNQPLSQAIKILMNSFYGVLGTPGCRFFDSRLPSSITLRGHDILTRSRDHIEQQLTHIHPLEVIYGDTDSLFIALYDCPDKATALDAGRRIESAMNAWWRDSLREQFGLKSFLELEFETHFSQFFMPRVRGMETGSKKRYAGFIEQEDGDYQLVFKGLEAVRTDWTPLARRFQYELYERIFLAKPFEEFVQSLVQQLYAGELDGELVYRKRIRQALNKYQRNVPPHAQAAQRADYLRQQKGLKPRYQRGGWIEYVISVNGPEAKEARQSPLDYDAYVEKQIQPIFDAIAPFLSTSFAQIMDNQLNLF